MYPKDIWGLLEKITLSLQQRETMKNGGMNMNKFLEELRKMLPEYSVSESDGRFIVSDNKRILKFTFNEADAPASVVAGKIRYAFEHLMDSQDEEIFFASYEAAKERLFIKAIPLERASGGIYHEIGDIALTVYLRLNPVEGSLRNIKVDKEKYPVDGEVIWQQAMLNTQKDKPIAFGLMDLLLGKGGTDLNSVQYNARDPFFISNESKINGAVVLFYPGLAEKLHNLVGEDYYAVFTSIHEFCIHPKSVMNCSDLKQILSDTIDESVSEDEVLTREIYEYSEGKISLCK